MSNCPCGNQMPYQDCCGQYHTGKHNPPTAESLMRARYSAFTKGEVDFIQSTHMPGTKDFDPNEAKDWSENSTWKGLEIINTKQGQADHNSGVVEFRALYADKEGKDYLHHEISTFNKVDDKWYYEEGQIVGTGPITRATPKVGRNEPCSCGSGKKFKKCCGA